MKKFYLLVISILFGNNIVFADLPHNALEAINNSIGQKYKDISPIFGFNLWESGLLSKIRKFGAYGGNNRKDYCHFKISKERYATQYPQDPIAAFIQRIIPAPPTGGERVGDVRGYNTTVSDPVSKLPFSVIGIMLKWGVDNQKYFSRANQDNGYKYEMVEALFNLILPFYKAERLLLMTGSEAKRHKAKLHTIISGPINSKLAQFKQAKEEDNTEHFDDEIELLELEIESLKSKESFLMESISKVPDQSLIQETMEKDQAAIQSNALSYELPLLFIFIQTFVDALVYENTDLAIQRYPKGITLHSLLAFFHKRADAANWEEAVKQLWSKVPEITAPPAINKPNNSIKDRSLTLIKTAYEEKFKNLLPPPFGTGSAICTPGQTSYSDCGESSLRSFFNVVLCDFETKQINPLLLNEVTALYQLTPLTKDNRGLLAFYSYEKGRYCSIGHQLENVTRDLWSAMVTSALEEVRYNVEGKCNIQSIGATGDERAGFDNMMMAIGKLIGDEILVRHAKQLKTLGKDGKYPVRTAALQRLCTLFSLPGRALKSDWDGKASSILFNYTITNAVSYTTMQAFEWNFSPGHFGFEIRANANSQSVLKNTLYSNLNHTTPH